MTYGVLFVILGASSLDSWQLDEGGDNMNRQMLGENLCKLCDQQQITVDALAELIGKSPRQVSRYRNGHFRTIPLDVLNDIAEALDTSISVLLSAE